MQRPAYNNKNRIARPKNILVVLTGILFVSTFVTRLYFTGIFASKNQELANIISHKTSLEKEISTLQYEAAGLSSLSYVEAQASNMGLKTFKGNVLTLDIKSSQPLATSVIR